MDPKAWRIKLLREWRKHVEGLAKYIKKVLPDAEVYVFGGAAEGRLTVLSDVDVLVVVDRKLSSEEKARLKADMLWGAEEYGVPWYYPFDIHVASKEEAKEYFRRARKVVRIA